MYPPCRNRGIHRIAVAVELDGKSALGETRLERRHAPFLGLAGSRIEAANERLAKIVVPDHPFVIEVGVVRQAPGVGQIVFRDDDARGSARGTRKSFQFIFPFARRTQIDRGQIFREFRVRLNAKLCRAMRRDAPGRPARNNFASAQKWSAIPVHRTCSARSARESGKRRSEIAGSSAPLFPER